MKKTLRISFLLVASLLALTTCTQPTASPCAGAKEPTAAFTMMEAIPAFYFGFTTYDTDSSSSTSIQFSALEPNAKYEWKIGTDTTIYNQQQFSIDFSDYYLQHQPNVPPIVVTLRVIKDPGSCFPASDSVKYMSRTLYLTNRCILNGIYRGRFNYDSATKIITINNDTVANRDNNFFISGLPNKDSLFVSLGMEAEITFYRKAIFNFLAEGTPPYYNIIQAEMMVTADGRTLFMWVKQNNPKLPQTYTFTGTRIH